MTDQENGAALVLTPDGEDMNEAKFGTRREVATQSDATNSDASTSDARLRVETAESSSSHAASEDAPDGTQKSNSPARKKKRSEILDARVLQLENEAKERRKAAVAAKRQLQGARRREQNERVRTQQILIGRWFLEVANGDPKMSAFIGRLIERKLQTPREHEAVSELYTKVTGKVLPVPPDPAPGAGKGRRKKPE